MSECGTYETLFNWTMLVLVWMAMALLAFVILAAVATAFWGSPETRETE